MRTSTFPSSTFGKSYSKNLIFSKKNILYTIHFNKSKIRFLKDKDLNGCRGLFINFNINLETFNFAKRKVGWKK